MIIICSDFSDISRIVRKGTMKILILIRLRLVEVLIEKTEIPIKNWLSRDNIEHNKEEDQQRQHWAQQGRRPAKTTLSTTRKKTSKDNIEHNKEEDQQIKTKNDTTQDRKLIRWETRPTPKTTGVNPTHPQNNGREPDPPPKQRAWTRPTPKQRAWTRPTPKTTGVNPTHP